MKRTKAGMLLAFGESTPTAFFAFWLLSANARFRRLCQPLGRCRTVKDEWENKI